MRSVARGRAGFSWRGIRVTLRRPSWQAGTVRRSFRCHGDALKSLACGNAGLRMVGHRKESHDRDRTATAFRQPKQLDAGILQAEISSFALRLAAEGKAAKTIR